MKIKLIIGCLILLLAAPLMALPRQEMGRSAVTASQMVDNTTFFDANRLMAFVTNHGNFGRDLSGVFGYDYGTWFPYVDTSLISEGGTAALQSPLYAAGLWIGGVDRATGDTLIALSEYDSEYVPGFMTGGTFEPDRPEFRVYKLYRDSLAYNPNQDYLDYMQYAVPDQGAPILKDSLGNPILDSLGNQQPDMVGDQMLWAVYNDADVAQHENDAGDTDPLGVEVKQTVFGFTRENPLGNIFFFRYRIYNKGGKTIDSMYISLWADPDLGTAGDDLVGCDTVLSLGYVYNADNDDGQYGSRPPALGFDFFQGPLQFTGNAEDTALMWDFTRFPGYRNLGMVSFNKYINGTDPDSYEQSYGFMRGLTKQGNPYVNPTTGQVTTFVHTGDPVTGTGDLDVAPADRRWMQSTGPITFAPGDSTEVLAAVVIGQGGDRLSSISVLKYYDQFAQTAYDIEFQIPEPPASPVVVTQALHDRLVLYWDNTSELEPGDYPFQGYTVYQGPSPAGPWTRIVNYDVVDGVAQILDAELDPLTGALEQRLVKNGNDGGLNHFYIAKTDALTGQDLHVGTKYYFRVEAYSYDPAATPKTLTSANAVPIEMTPQAPITGTQPTVETTDTLEVTHAAGGSDGVVTPLVVDPMALVDHDYEVTFGEDTTAGYTADTAYAANVDTVGSYEDTTIIGDTTIIVTMYILDTLSIDTTVEEHYDTTVTTFWTLTDLTTNTVKVEQNFNQSGDDDYPIVDGFMIKVAGPQLGVTQIIETENSGNPVDPPDNVAYSLNSTGDWYVSSDQGSNFERMNWRGLIGTYDWEFRWVDSASGSEYYDWLTDAFFPGNPRAPFEVWNIGIGTPNDPSDDVRIFFSIIDDDESGGWSWGDRIYPWEVEYFEPAPAVPPYDFPADFRIGRIVFNDYSEALTAPTPGTVVRFVTAKINTTADVFTFSGSAPITASTGPASSLDDIKTVPNPFYLFSSYDPSPANKVIKFTNLPAKATITIYNLSGDFVARIEKDDPATSIAQWDVRTDNGLPVASGIYIYHVNAPGFGEKIGKMAVFTEQEILQIY